jgi:hypothetical protein
MERNSLRPMVSKRCPEFGKVVFHKHDSVFLGPVLDIFFKIPNIYHVFYFTPLWSPRDHVVNK